MIKKSLRAYITACRAGLFHKVDDDISADGRKFDGIAHNVDEDLIQSQLVCDDILVLHILRVDNIFTLYAQKFCIARRSKNDSGIIFCFF